METWTVIADETHASLLVRSNYGPFYEIETWKRNSLTHEAFAQLIGGRLQELQSHFDKLVVAAPPAMLDRLCTSFPKELGRKVSGQYPRYLTHLSQRELGQQLRELCTV